MIRSLLFAFFVGLIVIGGIILFIDLKKKGVFDTKNGKNGKEVIVNKTSKTKGTTIGLSFIIPAVILTFLIPDSFHQVEAGQVAVVKTLGKIDGIRYPGTYFDFHLTKTYTYFDTTIQELDITTASYSSDAQTMKIQMTVQYKIDPTQADKILINYFTLDSLSQRIKKVADDRTKSVLSQYTAMKIIETRSTISPEVEAAVKESVGDKYFSTITAVNLTNIDFTDEFEKAVEDKVVAEQEKEAAITKAEQELEVAKLTAQSKIEAARGDAESQKIIASAAAEASAVRIVELAKSTGYTVNETYVVNEETKVVDIETSEVISDINVESLSVTTPTIGTNTVVDEDAGTRTTTTTTLTNTNYVIQYDAEHTAEGMSIVFDYVKYLQYLETWNGELPEVVAGEEAISIMVPSSK